ncbi:hypothetical protein M569_12184, partial [Genlisea aurea]
MSTEVAERKELARLCSSKDWSRAIRVLDSLLSHSSAIQDLCNRAFCYSQLELHKHVIKDCDKALQLDPNLIQAYVLKGHAFSGLGRKAEAISVWERGYELAFQQAADLKQFLELEDVLRIAKQNDAVSCQNPTIESPELDSSLASTVTSEDYCGYNEEGTATATATVPEPSSICTKTPEESKDNSDTATDVNEEGKTNKFSRMEDYNASLLICRVDFLLNDSSASSADEHFDLSEIINGSLSFAELQNEIVKEVNGSRKFCVSRILNKSVNVDIRLSRGIAQVNDGNYAQAISIFDKILEQEPEYPEALIGRGTAYAFQQELHSAIADFSKAIQSNPSAAEAWKRRGQARAALGESAKAIADLTKALEFEPNSPDILHERGIVNFKFKDYKAAVEDLSACVEIEKDNKSAFTYLGLALFFIGEYIRAEQAHLKAIQIDQNFVEAWTHLAQ